MVFVTAQQTLHSEALETNRQDIQDNVCIYRYSLSITMPKPPPEDVVKIQEFLPDNSKTKDVILWYMQHRVSKIIAVRKRIYKGE